MKQKIIPASVPESCPHLSVFWNVVAYLLGGNLILRNFSSLSIVTVSVPEARNRKGLRDVQSKHEN